MFGYVAANPALLDETETERYRGCYCGLCHTLRRRHRSNLTLTYDMTFLVLLFTSLYEPEEQYGVSRCSAHPVKQHSWWTTVYSDYAADMNLALAYHNCMDDWRDERKLSRLLLAKSMTRRYRRVREQYPRQCGAMERCMERLAAIEASDGSPDAAANCFGELMGELFVIHDDLWKGILRRLGEALGRFIYMMDAVLDFEQDQAHGRYNPLCTVPEDALLRTQPQTVLTMLIGECTMEFEKLPLVLDCTLLRSILYAGVWQKYAARNERQEAKRRGTGSI